MSRAGELEKEGVTRRSLGWEKHDRVTPKSIAEAKKGHSTYGALATQPQHQGSMWHVHHLEPWVALQSSFWTHKARGVCGGVWKAPSHSEHF